MIAFVLGRMYTRGVKGYTFDRWPSRKRLICYTFRNAACGYQAILHYDPVSDATRKSNAFPLADLPLSYESRLSAASTNQQLLDYSATSAVGTEVEEAAADLGSCPSPTGLGRFRRRLP